MFGSAPNKAARNEARKLVATLLNNVALAFLLAALLQPALAFLQQQRPVDLVVVGASLIFLLISFGAFVASQAVISGVEE